MKVIELKILPMHYNAVTEIDPLKRKTAEVRINDRNYEVGDVLRLREWEVDNGYSGKVSEFVVTHILFADIQGAGGLQPGYVMLSIIPRDLDLSKDGEEVMSYRKKGKIYSNQLYSTIVPEMHDKLKFEVNKRRSKMMNLGLEKAYGDSDNK
jgi:hypothetical protein